MLLFRGGLGRSEVFGENDFELLFVGDCPGLRGVRRIGLKVVGKFV